MEDPSSRPSPPLSTTGTGSPPHPNPRPRSSHSSRGHRWPRSSPAPASNSSLPTSLTPSALQSAVLLPSPDLLISHLRHALLHSPFTSSSSSSSSTSDAFAHVLAAATAIIDASPTPHSLCLTLLPHPSLARKRGDRVDLPHLLLTALTHCPSPLPPSLTPTALSLLPSLPLSPRAFSSYLAAYSIDLPLPSRWSFVDRLQGQGRCREAAELAMRLDVLDGASEERHRQLLTGLMKGGGGGGGGGGKGGNEGVQVDTIHAYLSSLRVRGVRERWRDWAITQVAEENGGNNLTAATRLLSFYHLPLSAFPRVSYLKRKHEVWWSCRMGKSDEFADVLVQDDVKLQRKLIQQLSRHRYAGDLERMHRRIRQYGLQHDEDVRAMLVALSTSPPLPPAAEQQDDDAAVPFYTVPLSSIVFVNDLPTLELASSTLTTAEGARGFDCEFIPEAFHQLGLAASHTQLLQVACESHSFLFDLQCLSPPTHDAVTARMVDVLMEVMSREGVKVGIGFAEDLRKMRKDFAHLACFQVTVSQYADLTPLLKEERPAAPTTVPAAAVEQEGKKKEKRWKEKQKQRQWKAKAAAAQPPPSSSPSPLADVAVDDDSKAADLLPVADEPSSPTPSPPLLVGEAAAVHASSGFVPFTPKVGGLAKLTRQYTGRRLDKACQISQWARRPLTPQQSMYAACDAHVQLLIYAEAARRGRQLKEVELEG